MPENMPHRIAFGLYNLLWSGVLPWLQLNHRLAEGYGQRRLKTLPPAADIWIQAASVGESYLALEIIKGLNAGRPVKILVTSNTSQGVDILNQGQAQLAQNGEGIEVAVGYFPFDKPALMKKAVSVIQPAVMVLLETEIWPGLLRALKQQQCRTLIVNGRVTAGSLKRYLLWPSIWPPIRPDRILAISSSDADRFKQIFGPEAVEIMPNIKFDRVAGSISPANNHNPLKDLIPDSLIFAVLASVRRQEESRVKQVINTILDRRPQTVIGLFPRHMHRIKSWQEILSRAGITWSLRSGARGPATAGSVILWDTFGELQQSYGLCQAAYVGGSLAPLGGQNFLEAMICGIKPVMGPSWENFLWVGTEIIDSGLLRIADDWQAAAAQLIKDMDHPPPRDEVISQSLAYIENRRGGTARVCRTIVDLMAAEN